MCICWWLSRNGTNDWRFVLLNTHTYDTRTVPHIVQFIYLGYDGFRFPIAYYPTAGDNEPEIYIMVRNVINKLKNIMISLLIIYALVVVVRHFNDTSDSKKKNFTTVYPYFPSQKVTLMRYYSHNIKKLRNNIHFSGNSNFSTWILTKQTQVIIWDFWIKAYKWDKKYETPIRVHQKLTDEHIFLNKL